MDESRGSTTISLLNEFQPDIYGIYVMMENGATMKSRYFDLKEEDFRASQLYQDILYSEEPIWLTPENGSTLAYTTGDPVIACGVSMRDIISGKPCGIIIIEVKKFLIQKMLSLDIGKGGEIFLLNDSLDLVALSRQSKQEAFIQEMTARLTVEQLHEGDTSVEVPNGTLLYHRMDLNDWYVAGFVPHSALRESGKIITVLVVLVSVLLCGIISIAAMRISRYELKPIRAIVLTMGEIENNNLQARCEVVRPDEIGAMASNFNHMADHVLQLTENIRSEQEKLRLAEFRTLQSQIKPHFLYNTLDSIAWLARKRKNQKVIDTVMALTDFFRISLSRGADIITVSEELDHVINYLKIQKIRYDNIFSYDIFAELGTRKYLIPKLVLQPLVENALYHGIKPSGRKCMININVFDQGDNLYIEVIDNGIGMSEESLQDLHAALQHEEDTKLKSFGLVNVHDRIWSFSGGKFGLSVISKQGMGTLVAIQLAKKKKGTDSGGQASQR